jgi:hypothetical protein
MLNIARRSPDDVLPGATSWSLGRGTIEGTCGVTSMFDFTKLHANSAWLTFTFDRAARPSEQDSWAPIIPGRATHGDRSLVELDRS